MVDVPDCCYCGAPWTLGGYAHTRTCFITTGHLTLEAGRRAKRNRAAPDVNAPSWLDDDVT